MTATEKPAPAADDTGRPTAHDDAGPPSPPTGHVIVYGVRGVGLRTVEQLHAAGVAVVVVEAGPEDADPVAERLLTAWGVPRHGGRTREALAAAGLDRAAAVVCVPDDDLQAMQVALLVRRTRPDVRLVVRMDNTAVGRALAQVTGEGSVLDVAALAARPVVEACLGRRPRPFTVAGRTFVAAELVADRDATLRELYGELAPVAVARHGADTLICPDRDAPVRRADRVTAVGTLEQFAARGVPVGEGERPASRHAAGARSAGAARAARLEEHGGAPGLRALLRSLVDEADRQLKMTLLTLFAVFLVSVVVLRLGYVKESGERHDPARRGLLHRRDHRHRRLRRLLLRRAGAVAAGLRDRPDGRRGRARGHPVRAAHPAPREQPARALVRAAPGRGDARARHRRRARRHRRPGRRGPGGGRTPGRRLELDPANRHLARVRALDVPVVAGDATDTTVLATVNLASATAVAVLTSDDLVNVETGLAVRDQLGERWAGVPVVLRVFDRELGVTIREGFDFRYVRSTEALVAPWFVGAALGLDVLGTFHVDQEAFLVGHLRVAPGGGLDGLARQDLSARTRVIAIHRANSPEGVLEHPPRPQTRFVAGDEIYLVGPYEELLSVLRRDTLGRDTLGRDAVISPSVTPVSADER